MMLKFLERKPQLIAVGIGLSVAIAAVVAYGLKVDEDCATPGEVVAHIAEKMPQAVEGLKETELDAGLLAGFLKVSGYPLDPSPVAGITIYANSRGMNMVIPYSAKGCAFKRDGAEAKDEEVSKALSMVTPEFIVQKLLQQAAGADASAVPEPGSDI